MNDNTVFNSPQPSSGSLPQPSSFDPSLYENPIPWGMIIKIIIGIIFLALIVFLSFKFVIPYFKTQKKENVTLVYWGLWEDEKVMNPILREFEKQNPTIKVQYIRQDPKQYRERIIARTQNGIGPDIFRFHNTWVSMMSQLLLPLPEDVVSKKDFEKNYYPVIQKDLARNGAIYGIPLAIDTLSLFVNTDILTSAGLDTPKTWNEFLQSAKQVTVLDSNESGGIKTAGAAMGTYDNINHASDIISLLFLQNGADLKELSKNDNASDALSFYTGFAKSPNTVWSKNLDNSLLSFAKGNLAFYFGYSWDIFTIKSIDPNLKFKIYDVPRISGENITIASYWAEGVSSKSKHPKEAFVFISFLGKKDTLAKLYKEQSKIRLFGELYPRIDMGDLLKQNDMLYPFVRQAKNARSSFFSSNTHDNGLNDKANAYLKRAVEEVLENTSSQTAIETLTHGVSQILKQYGQ